jgi:hypothetical protein
MENLVNDWKDKQGIHEKHVVEPDPVIDLAEALKRQVAVLDRREREKAIEILERYNSLLKEEEPDYDLWEILPKVTDKFLQKYYPKI